MKHRDTTHLQCNPQRWSMGSKEQAQVEELGERGHQMERVQNTTAPGEMRGRATGDIGHEVGMTLHSHSSVFSPLTELNSINEVFFFPH